MDLFLDETDSISTLCGIRIEKYADMESSKELIENKTLIRSCIDIDLFNNLWNKVTVELLLDTDTDSIQEIIDGTLEFNVFLTNDINQDKLIIANSEIQELDNSNIFDIIMFMYNEIWVPIVNGDLILTEDEWENIIPDTFHLVPEPEFNDHESEILERAFDIVIANQELSGLLHAEFFMGKQPIIIGYQEFFDFCKQYELFE